MSHADRAARSTTLRAAILVLIGAAGVQSSAAISISLFEPLGILQTSTMRLLVAAVILLVIFRPRIKGRAPEEWFGIVIYGVTMAALNVFMYLAIDRIPLGVASTIAFLGPCLVALTASRKVSEGLLAVAALGGVALIAGLGGPFDPIGMLFASAMAVSLALYTLFAVKVGQSIGGLPSMALSVAVAALITLPISVPAIPNATAPHWGLILLSVMLGTALVFTTDTLAGRLTSARVLGVFFAFDPLMGTLVGAVFLRQALSLPTIAGIALVVAAGAGIVWSAGRRGDTHGIPPTPSP